MPIAHTVASQDLSRVCHRGTARVIAHARSTRVGARVLTRSCEVDGNVHAATTSQPLGEAGIWEQAALDRRRMLQAAVTLILTTTTSPLPAFAATNIQRVFVAGATGATGRRVVQQLRAQGYLVTAGVRDVSKGKKVLGSEDAGLTVVQADVTKGSSYLEKAIGDSQAVISAIGAAFNAGAVDEKGAISLIDAAKARGVEKFVMVSSLLTNAPAMGQAENPNYKFLNLFGQVLDRKLVAENYLKASGLNYTIVRPGGLSSEPPEKVGNLIVSGEDTLFGLDNEPGREISRDTVAAVCIAALEQSNADNVVVEIVANPAAPVLPKDKWFVV